MNPRLATLSLASALLFSCGAKKEEASSQSREAPASADKMAPAPPPKSTAVFAGRLEGVVRLAEEAKLPRIENMKDGSTFSMVEPPAPCSPLAKEDLTPVAMAENRELRDIHIALTGMKDYPEPVPKTRDLYLSDCRLTPKLIGVAAGDTLRITNRSPIPLLPVFTGESFMPAIMPESSRLISVEKSGASRIACTFGSYCGRTEVLSTAHPLFAVSDANGRFVIENIPLDQDVTVHGWHPFFQDSTLSVRLTASEPKRTIELFMTPLPQAAPADEAKQAPASGKSPASAKSPAQTKPKAAASPKGQAVPAPL